MTAWTGKRWLTLILAAYAVAVCLVALAGWWYGPWRQQYAVPIPPSGASGRQTVRAYLRALDAHDSATAEALSAPSAQSTTRMWLSSTASVRRIRIYPAHCPASGSAGRRCDVLTTFRYTSHWWKQDASFPDGEHAWAYSLSRGRGRWLVDGGGMG